MSKRGKLFVLEGPDGVGKSTLAQVLTKHLNSIKVPCDYLAFPGHEAGTLGRHVYDFHHNPVQFGVETVHPTSVQVLHIAAHIDAIERQILPTLESGRSIVLDRFWWSTWVYGKVSGVNSQSLEAMLNAEFVHWNEILPTLVFLLSRSTPVGTDEPIETWNKLCAAYYELANEQRLHYPVEIVNNDRGISQTISQILERIALSENMQMSAAEGDEVQDTRGSLSFSAAQLDLDFPSETNTNIPQATAPLILTRLSPAEPTEVFDTYWRFATERQEIFFRRLEGASLPWTTDPILSKYKFTNAYRASDRVSQYLIKQVIYNGDQLPEEIFFRTLLFKIFNRIETWELLTSHLGELRYSEYSFERYDTILTEALDEGYTIFSAAYIMPSGGTSFGYSKKHRNLLRLLESMLIDEVPSRLTEMRSMRQAFELLRSYPMVGDFLAYQYVTDINYSQLTNFSEMEFVVPGPGARDGLRKCFRSLGGLNEADIIRLAAERQQEEFSRLGLHFRSLWGRPLQLIDCQNVFCEVDKYARIAHPYVKGMSDRKRIKQGYQSSMQPIAYWYPPKWEINHLI
jgi:thymidylate kinase